MKHIKIKPCDTTVDHRYQRELDARRVEAMTKRFSPSLMGVPVVARREDGSLVRIDGQHRCAAAISAGHGDVPVMMEVYEGLTLQQEAELFLQLNGGRTAVGAVDKYKARLEAREPVALEIQGLLKKHGLRVGKVPARNCVLAIQAVERAFHRGTLDSTLFVLCGWCEGDAAAFDGLFVRAVSLFLSYYPDVDPRHLVSRLEQVAPSRLETRLRREAQSGSSEDAARLVLTDIYNHRTPVARRVRAINAPAGGQA
jgi:hypothetical protein